MAADVWTGREQQVRGISKVAESQARMLRVILSCSIQCTMVDFMPVDEPSLVALHANYDTRQG